MKKQDFIKKVKSLTGEELSNFIQQFGKKEEDINCYISQYDPEKHKIFDKQSRPDKQVLKPTGQKKEDGTDVTISTTQPVSRIAIDAQQDITKSAAGILCSNKIELYGDREGMVQSVWDRNRLDLKTINTCSTWLSMTEVAELWYKVDGEYKVMILSPELGDRFYPVFDDYGDMICFGRKYISTELDKDDQLQKYSYYEIYLDTEVIKGDNLSGMFTFGEWQLHGMKQIPVVYGTRKRPVWWNVQGSIERTEVSVSNLCDTNDYFGSPTAVVRGKILSYADKGESGKLIEIDPSDGGDIRYLTWDQAPESVKLEWEKLNQIIYEGTRTVNLSITNLKGVFGSAPSTYAIKLLFTPAHMQAAENEEVFGEYIQRRINLISSFVGVKKGVVTPKFTYYLPKNDQEDQNNIIAAKDAGILSVESAVEQSITTTDAETEKVRLGITSK